MRLFVAIVVLAVATTARADHLEECRTMFIQAMGKQPSTPCLEVEAYAKCVLSGPNALDDVESVNELIAKFKCDSDKHIRDRRDTTSLFNVIERVNALRGVRDNLRQAVADRVQASFQEDTALLSDELRDTIDLVREEISAERAASDDLREQINEATQQLQATRNSRVAWQTNLQETVTTTINGYTAALEDQGGSVLSAITEQSESLTGQMNDAIDTLTDEVTRAQEAENSMRERWVDLETAAQETMEELEELAQTQPPIIWSGGCRHHGHGGGWSTYCFNGNDRTDQFPQALYNDYIEPRGGDIRFRQEGYYRLNWWAIQHGCGSYNVQFESSWNGGHRNMGYAHRESKPHGWFSNFMDQTWAFKEGDRFWMTVHGGWCNPYRWHSWNHNGHHSRMQVTYVGGLAD